MILQTGGRAVGATSTRSRPASRARRSASLVGVGPIFTSLSSMRKTGEIRICSLWRKLVEMARTPTESSSPRARAADERRICYLLYLHPRQEVYIKTPDHARDFRACRHDA